MGATDFVLTGESDFAQKYAGQLDLIIVTTDVSKAIPISDLVPALGVHGRLIICAMPDDALPPMKSQSLAGNGALIGGTHIGSKKEVLQMLKLAVDHKIGSWVEELPSKLCCSYSEPDPDDFSVSQCGKAVQNVKDNKVKYRHVLKCVLSLLRLIDTEIYPLVEWTSKTYQCGYL